MQVTSMWNYDKNSDIFLLKCNFYKKFTNHVPTHTYKLCVIVITIKCYYHFFTHYHENLKFLIQQQLAFRLFQYSAYTNNHKICRPVSQEHKLDRQNRKT